MPRKKNIWLEAFPDQRLSKPKERKQLPKVSKRRVVVNRDYAKSKKEWKRLLIGLGAWKCKKCGGVPSDSPHHFRGRAGALLCHPGFFVPLCPPCHSWVDGHRFDARRMGLLCPIGDWGRQPPHIHIVESEPAHPDI